MACLDSGDIIAFNDPECDIQGWIHDDYPGCGLCSYCCSTFSPQKREEIYQKAKQWEQVNTKRYLCKWTNLNGFYGEFSFRSTSLEKAREVAQASVYDWTSILVSEKHLL